MKCPPGCECRRHHRTREQISYLKHVKIFVEALGRGPHTCPWCNEPVMVEGGRAATSGTIHHLNHDHYDNRLENLAACHFGCHTRHHHKRKTLSAEARAKVSAAQKGVPDGPPPEAVRKKLSAALKGRPHTAEHNRKVGDAQRGRKLSDEQKQKLSDGQKRHGAVGTYCESCGAGPFAGNRGRLMHQRQTAGCGT